MKSGTWILIVLGFAILGSILHLLWKEREKKKEPEVKVDEVTDYNMYVMTHKEKIIYIFIAAGVIFVVAYIFYRSIFLSIMMMPFALLYPKRRTHEIINQRKQKLTLQFKDALYSLSSSVSAGKSIEIAFKEAVKDLLILYPDSNTMIIQEMQYMINRIEMNEPIESALKDFANRSHIEDIQNFADVFQTCKRSGGNLVQVIKNTSEIIQEKITIRQEIDTMIAEKKFEHKVLMIMPIAIMLLLSTSAEDFMAPVFTETIGKLVMTVAIFMMGIAYYISKKIMEIEI